MHIKSERKKNENYGKISHIFIFCGMKRKMHDMVFNNNTK